MMSLPDRALASSDDVSCLSFTACGRPWSLERGNMEELWDSMTEFPTDDERLPYWAELWPSSLALAEWLHAGKERIAGRKCLDIGCGIGFTALVGAWCGARVIGMDYERQALDFARRNADRNSVASPVWCVMDWRRPAVRAASIEVAWGGDVMYERRFAEPLAAFLHTVLAPGGLAFVAEPSRTVYEHFLGAVTGRGMGVACVHRVDVKPLVPQEKTVPVRIWRIQR